MFRRGSSAGVKAATMLISPASLAPLLMRALALPAALSLGGCVTYHTTGDGIVRTRIGETAAFGGGARVTPLTLIEDSRCPANARCVWAGRVRITATLGDTTSKLTRELTLGQPTDFAGGTLTLVEVLPVKTTQQLLYPDDYRFGFTLTAK